MAASSGSKLQAMRLGVAFLYGCVGLAMHFLNKAVLMDFKYSNTVLTIQMLISATICYTLRSMGIVHFKPLDMKTTRTLAPVVFFYNANVAFALAGLKSLKIPMYNVIKRMTPVLVLVTKIFMTKTLPPLQISLSVLTTVAGCIVAGIGDFEFDLMGYLLAMSSCVLQATYLVLVEKTGADRGLSSTELLVYNSVLSFPVLLVLILVTGEAMAAQSAMLRLAAESPWFVPNLLLSSVMGVLLNYTLFLCTLLNSALTTTIVGVMRSVASTLLGFFLLGGMKPHSLNCAGIFLNMVGGTWYTFAKFKGKSQRKSSEEPTAIISEKSERSTESQPLLPANGKLLDSLGRK